MVDVGNFHIIGIMQLGCLILGWWDYNHLDRSLGAVFHLRLVVKVHRVQRESDDALLRASWKCCRWSQRMIPWPARWFRLSHPFSPNLHPIYIYNLNDVYIYIYIYIYSHQIHIYIDIHNCSSNTINYIYIHIERESSHWASSQIMMVEHRKQRA